MNTATKLTHLQSNLNELKLALNSPRIFLANFFNELCSQIDVECELFLQENSKNEQKSSQAIDLQNQQIDQVKAFEKSCLSNIADTQLDESLSKRIAQIISKIESEIDLESAKDQPNSQFIAVNDELVQSHLVEIQKYLFNNRSIWFFSRRFSQKHYIHKYSSFGYLTIIMDEFLSQKSLEM